MSQRALQWHLVGIPPPLLVWSKKCRWPQNKERLFLSFSIQILKFFLLLVTIFYKCHQRRHFQKCKSAPDFGRWFTNANLVVVLQQMLVGWPQTQREKKLYNFAPRQQGLLVSIEKLKIPRITDFQVWKISWDAALRIWAPLNPMIWYLVSCILYLHPPELHQISQPSIT